MRRLVAVALATASVALPGCGRGADPAPQDRSLARARAIFGRIGPTDPYCSAAVLRGDRVVFAQAFGTARGHRATPATKGDIASVSKQFTGVAIQRLIAQGDLSGDDLVGDLVPASRPATDDLTVDQLLTHTSGLADYGDLLVEEYDERTTQAEAVAAIARSRPTGTRGRFDYSNSNYVLLAEVVRAVDGRSLPRYLHDEVFEPLDLDMAVAPHGAWRQVGDGSVWTTPTELVRWSRQYWHQTLDGPRLARVMFRRTVDASEGDPDVDDEYGSGILRATLDDGAVELFHDGSWDGYETDWALIPEEHVAAAVTCNEQAPLRADSPAEALLAIYRPEV